MAAFWEELRMNWKTIGLRALLLTALTCFLVSCKAPPSMQSAVSAGDRHEDPPKIIFLDYLLTRDPDGSNYRASMLQKIIREGKIKEVHASHPSPLNNDLELRVLDRNQQILGSHHIPNPLDRSVEYVNDAHQLEYKMVHLDSAQFSVRIQIQPGAESVLLLRYSAYENEGIPLLKTSIQ